MTFEKRAEKSTIYECRCRATVRRETRVGCDSNLRFVNRLLPEGPGRIAGGKLALGERSPRTRNPEWASALEGRRRNTPARSWVWPRPVLPAPFQGAKSIGLRIRGLRSPTRLPPAIFRCPSGTRILR